MFFPAIQSYVETHFRYKFGISLLSRKEPEIFFDAPFRIEPGLPLVAMLFIKDADQYPIELQKITAAIGFNNHRIFLKEIEPDITQVNRRYYSQLFRFPLPDDYHGEARLNFKLECKIRGRDTIILNDNLPFGSHSDYPILVSKTSLPTLPGYIQGETHCHSNFTDDEVEFGMPPEVIPEMAKALGLSFAMLTDHSYDLDPRNPFSQSPNAFKTLRSTVLAQTAKDFVLIPGEEVSAKNHKNKSVHLCVINHPDFIEGYGDCGRNPTQSVCKHSIEDIQKQTEKDENTLVFAAHPGYQPSRIESFLLNRGKWHPDDYSTGPEVLQIWNGCRDKTFEKGLSDWTTLLLGGHKRFVIAGNDAHGDFNRTRKIGIPFLSIHENAEHSFGRVRTAIPVETLSSHAILQAIRQGRAIMTSGPLLRQTIHQNGTEYQTGDRLSANEVTVTLEGVTTEEFGSFKSVRLIHGTIGDKETIIPINGSHKEEQKTWTHSLAITQNGYLRAELTTQKNQQLFFAYTNPIWINPSPVTNENP